MRYHIVSASLSLGIGVLMSWSCASDEISTRIGAGRIYPLLDVSADVIMAHDVNHTIIIDTVPDPEQFSLMLKEDMSGHSFTWDCATDFLTTDLYRTGTYTLTAWYGNPLGEGFDAAFYYAEATFDVCESQITKVPLNCSLYNTMIDFSFDESLYEYFESVNVIVHSPFGSFLSYNSSESRPLFLRPGDVWLALEVRDLKGRTAIFKAADMKDANIGYYYHVDISLINEPAGQDPKLCLSFSELIDTDDIYIPVNESLFEVRAPVVQCMGFTSGVPLNLPEGTTPAEPVKVHVSSPSLQSVMISTQSMEVIMDDWPNEIDLMKLTEENLNSLRSIGFYVERTDTSLTADFSQILANLSPTHYNHTYTFNTVASDHTGHISEPVSLIYDARINEITLIQEPVITAGSDRGSVIIESSDPIVAKRVSIEIQGAQGGEWNKADILEVKSTEGNTSEIIFAVDPSTTETVGLRVSYCGVMRYEMHVRRRSPLFSVEIDPYAMKADLRIVPFDPDMRSYITRNVKAYVNGELWSVINRNTDTGCMTLTGLSDNTEYTVRLTVIDQPEEQDFYMPVSFRTEKAVTLPNGDFEDIEEYVSNRRIDCGGRYSQNFVEIFNQQNTRVFDINIPLKWANTNAKTFNTSASRHNTWYMQPSVMAVNDAYSGAYAVCLTSVGWDTDGPEIPDYLQESQPFVNFSRIIPRVAHRATGKLFIGQYTYNTTSGTEYYKEGMSISARPSALNGFYKYAPSELMPYDRGYVRIDVFGMVNGELIEIAHAESELVPATGYTAFSVPINYTMFGIKASMIRVMLASSKAIGTIDEETDLTLIEPNMPDACLRGSSLWLDGLSFSY